MKDCPPTMKKLFILPSICGRATVYLVEELERGNIELHTKDRLIG
jgi:hypothetical protein